MTLYEPIASQITGDRVFVQQLHKTDKRKPNKKTPRPYITGHFWGESTSDEQGYPLTSGQWCGKGPHAMTSSFSLTGTFVRSAQTAAAAKPFVVDEPSGPSVKTGEVPGPRSKQLMKELDAIQVNSGLLLCLRPANERRRYFVTTPLIGWAQT